MSELVFGVFAGLGAAFFQSCSYFGSRRFLTEFRSDPIKLFLLSHTQMLLTVLAIPFLLGSQLPVLSEVALPLIGTAGCYLVGQFMLLTALRHAESSMVAPLLGLKVVFLALITALVFGESISPLAWVGVFLCTTAAMLISPPKGVPEAKTLSLALMACLGYCGSDLSIPHLIAALEPYAKDARLLAVCLTYTVCGIPALIIAALTGILKDRQGHAYAAPYSFCWLTGMCCLFACFASVGVVYGNMLQSTRSFLSVLIGLVISAMGMSHIEKKMTATSATIRLGGACLMTFSIILFLLAEKL